MVSSQEIYSVVWIALLGLLPVPVAVAIAVTVDVLPAVAVQSPLLSNAV